MVLVIPVSHVDLDLAVKLAKRIIALGDIPDKIVMPCSWRAHWDIDRVTQFLPRALKFILPFEEEIGWPESANTMFYFTALHMYDHHPDEDWYFMEADTYPLKANWWFRLQQVYNANKHHYPYMGVVCDTVRLDMATGKLRTTGQHMTGTGIYPRDFTQRCKSIHYLAREPWDIEIAEEILPKTHHTELIAHRWGSYGYYLKDGIIHVGGSRSPNQAHVRPIPPEAVVLHGCKDDSIYAMGYESGKRWVAA